MSRRILFISDLQVPDHDAAAVAAVQAFTRDWAPHMIVGVGDEADSPEPSRWNKGMAEEYAGTLQDGLDETHQVLRGFREAAPDAGFVVSRSNHADRIQNYVARYAPALGSLQVLQYPALLRLDEIGVRFSERPIRVAPDTVVVHGDEGNMRQAPGATALFMAKRFGMSVVCGHTHRLGLQHDATAMSGVLSRQLWGLEVGHLMDMSRATYLKGGFGNWAQGFAVGRLHGGRLYTSPVPIHGRSFSVEGQVYTW